MFSVFIPNVKERRKICCKFEIGHKDNHNSIAMNPSRYRYPVTRF
jgi:hypothetical protein